MNSKPRWRKEVTHGQKPIVVVFDIVLTISIGICMDHRTTEVQMDDTKCIQVSFAVKVFIWAIMFFLESTFGLVRISV